MGDFNISKVNTPLSSDFKQMLAGTNLTNVIKVNKTRLQDWATELEG